MPLRRHLLVAWHSWLSSRSLWRCCSLGCTCRHPSSRCSAASQPCRWRGPHWSPLGCRRRGRAASSCRSTSAAAPSSWPVRHPSSNPRSCGSASVSGSVASASAVRQDATAVLVTSVLIQTFSCSADARATPCACHLSRQWSCSVRMESMDSMCADRVPSSDAHTSAACRACDLSCSWVRSVLRISSPSGNNASSQGHIS
mmetsp:Transcript_1643/g.4843  ORF Transcript_1643/g.4843 Transcript_1643/m.4843 type:complete len:200 (+) Transcript_1643:265-864(+)